MELDFRKLNQRTRLALLHDKNLPEEFRGPLNQLVLSEGVTDDDDSFIEMCRQTAAEQKGAKPPAVEASHSSTGNPFIDLCEQTAREMRDEVLA